MLIGQEASTGAEVPIPSFVSPKIQVLRQSLRARGIPEDWIPACREYRWRSDVVVDLGVGGQYPRRSVDELREAVAMGLGLNLYVGDGIDLGLLADIIGSVPRLLIAATGDSTTGWGVLRSAAQLERLTLTFEPSEELSLSLPSLVDFSGVGARAAAIVASPNLQSLELDGLDAWPDQLVVAGPVEHLQFGAASRVETLPPLQFPTRLRDLRVHGARKFDLASLPVARCLEAVDIAPCSILLHCEALLELPMLREVAFAQVREMENWESLRSLSVERFSLTGNWVIPAHFMSSVVVGNPTRWDIAAMKSPRSGVRR